MAKQSGADRTLNNGQTFTGGISTAEGAKADLDCRCRSVIPLSRKKAITLHRLRHALSWMGIFQRPV